MVALAELLFGVWRPWCSSWQSTSMAFWGGVTLSCCCLLAVVLFGKQIGMLEMKIVLNLGIVQIELCAPQEAAADTDTEPSTSPQNSGMPEVPTKRRSVKTQGPTTWRETMQHLDSNLCIQQLLKLKSSRGTDGSHGSDLVLDLFLTSGSGNLSQLCLLPILS